MSNNDDFMKVLKREEQISWLEAQLRQTQAALDITQYHARKHMSDKEWEDMSNEVSTAALNSIMKPTGFRSYLDND